MKDPLQEKVVGKCPDMGFILWLPPSVVPLLDWLLPKDLASLWKPILHSPSRLLALGELGWETKHPGQATSSVCNVEFQPHLLMELTGGGRVERDEKISPDHIRQMKNGFLSASTNTESLS